MLLGNLKTGCLCIIDYKHHFLIMIDNELLVSALTQLAQTISNTDEEHPFLLAK